MLEDRPILQRSLIGFGAFTTVFTAAMAGSAFMISGGLGIGGEGPRRDYSTARTAWDEFAPPASAAVPVYVTPQIDPQPIAPAAYIPEPASTEALVGDAVSARATERVSSRSEADILRDIERDLDRYEAENSASLYEPEVADAPDPYIAAAKEQAEAGYGAY